MKRYCNLAAVAVFFLLLGMMPAGAQVSLGSGEQTDVLVTVDGEEETFTILRHWEKRDQFYYVPNAPRLATRGTGSKKKPVFHLLSYQAKDTETNDIVQGGIMQFSVRLAAPPEVIPQMRQKIAGVFNIPEPTIKLSTLPFKTAEITMYGLDGQLLKTEIQKPGVAPAFSNNEIPFQVQLSDLSTNVYAALTTGGGGIPIFITYTFDQVSPEVGFEVTVDWDKSFSHLSSDSRTKQAYTQWYYYRTWWGGRRSASKTGQNESRQQSLSEVLQETSCITTKSLADETFTQEEISKFLDPIIEQISKEMVESVEPPEKIEPAAAKEPQNANWSGSSSTYAMKKVSKVKKGSKVISMKRRQMFETKSTYGSLLNISEYKSMKDDLITIVPAGNWSYAYFPVPAVGDSLNIKKVDLQVIPRFYDKNGKLQQIRGSQAELLTWTPDNGYFTDRKRKEITNILFPLQAITDQLAKENIPLASCAYEVIIKIVQNNEEMVFKSIEEFLLGGIPVSSPMAGIEGVEVDCEALEFGTEKGDLYAVSIEIKPTFPKKTYKTTIKEKDANKCPIFLVEKEDKDKKNPIKANINFTLVEQNTKTPWVSNGRDLQDNDLGLSIVLWNRDYKTAD